MIEQSILFLCTGNSCRSQMAEGWTRHLRKGRFVAYSAGIEKHGLNPHAVRAMSEVGVDISLQKSKHVDDLVHLNFDWVVTVCDHANKRCPIFPRSTRVVSHSFDDPPKLAALESTAAAAFAHYQRVRDEIRAFVEALPQVLEAEYLTTE